MRLKTFMTFDENRQVAKKILNKSFRSRFVSHHFLTMALLLHFKFLTTICSKKPQNIIYSLSNFFDTEGEKGKFWGIPSCPRHWFGREKTNENIKRCNWTAKLLKLLAVTNQVKRCPGCYICQLHIWKKPVTLFELNYFYCYAGKIQFLFVKFWFISMDLFDRRRTGSSWARWLRTSTTSSTSSTVFLSRRTPRPSATRKSRPRWAG